MQDNLKVVFLINQKRGIMFLNVTDYESMTNAMCYEEQCANAKF